MPTHAIIPQPRPNVKRIWAIFMRFSWVHPQSPCPCPYGQKKLRLIAQAEKRGGVTMPYPLFPTADGWMWSDGIVRATDSMDEVT